MAVTHLPPFARLLRHYRAEAELTQEALAERASLSARAISDLERGVKTRPHRVTVELLADAMDLSAEDRGTLADAVPRTNGRDADANSRVPKWLASGALPRAAEAGPMRCPPQLRQVLEGLVGLYVDEERRDGQINVTVIMFSVGDQPPGS